MAAAYRPTLRTTVWTLFQFLWNAFYYGAVRTKAVLRPPQTEEISRWPTLR
ncbi:hypothetical protein BS35_004935 [Actinomadura glauciflava]|nr:hypothetical protein [Actinomadura glauciflava]